MAIKNGCVHHRPDINAGCLLCRKRRSDMKCKALQALRRALARLNECVHEPLVVVSLKHVFTTKDLIADKRANRAVKKLQRLMKSVPAAPVYGQLPIIAANAHRECLAKTLRFARQLLGVVHVKTLATALEQDAKTKPADLTTDQLRDLVHAVYASVDQKDRLTA